MAHVAYIYEPWLVAVYRDGNNWMLKKFWSSSWCRLQTRTKDTETLESTETLRPSPSEASSPEIELLHENCSLPPLLLGIFSCSQVIFVSRNSSRNFSWISWVEAVGCWMCPCCFLLGADFISLLVGFRIWSSNALELFRRFVGLLLFFLSS